MCPTFVFFIQILLNKYLVESILCICFIHFHFRSFLLFSACVFSFFFIFSCSFLFRCRPVHLSMLYFKVKWKLQATPALIWKRKKQFVNDNSKVSNFCVEISSLWRTTSFLIEKIMRRQNLSRVFLLFSNDNE